MSVEIVAIHQANQARNAAVKAQAASDELRRKAQGGVGGVGLGFGNRSHAVAYDIFVEVSCVPRQ